MAEERTTSALKTHVPLALLIAAIGLTATVLIKMEAVVKSSVQEQVSLRLTPMQQRLEALEERVTEIRGIQVGVVKDLRDLAVELASQGGEARARRGASGRP